jgi:hypothetical protein
MASANTVTAGEKIAASGRALALGLHDDAMLDEALLLAAALSEVEAPHMRVLAVIVGVTYGETPQGLRKVSWKLAGNNAIDPHIVTVTSRRPLVVSGVMAVLLRHGLVEKRDTVGVAPIGGAAPVGSSYYSTPLGVACVQMLLPEPPDWATDHAVTMSVINYRRP